MVAGTDRLPLAIAVVGAVCAAAVPVEVKGVAVLAGTSLLPARQRSVVASLVVAELPS